MKNTGKTAVMYGAGNIGRGFIGQIFFDSGYDVVFIDISSDIINAINKNYSYKQVIVDGDDINERVISAVRAVDGRAIDAVAKEIANCEIMAVSVGAAALPLIASTIAEGLKARKTPLNILVCENLLHAPEVLRGYVAEKLSDLSILNKTGFIGTTIGRMVPVMHQTIQKTDPTQIHVEKFCLLPIDGDAIIPPMPKLLHTVLCSPFAFEEGKKLYIHNMGHALAAYFGALKNYVYIWQAIIDGSIYECVHNAMTATAKALAKKYKTSLPELEGYVDDLLKRFGNKGLEDTVARVGADPMRKLSPGDRLIGAIDLCKEQSINYDPILSGINAALKYNAPDDSSAQEMQKQLATIGKATFLSSFCGLTSVDIFKCFNMVL